MKANSISVAAKSTDPKAHKVRKFYNSSETIYVRPTTPDVSLLTELAAWLVTHIKWNVFGRETTAYRVLCYSGITEKERLLKTATTEARRAAVEKLINCYGDTLDSVERIDYLFPVIEPGETDEQYWNRAAKEMITAGVRRIRLVSPSEDEVSFTIASPDGL